MSERHWKQDVARGANAPQNVVSAGSLLSGIRNTDIDFSKSCQKKPVGMTEKATLEQLS